MWINFSEAMIDRSVIHNPYRYLDGMIPPETNNETWAINPSTLCEKGAESDASTGASPIPQQICGSILPFMKSLICRIYHQVFRIYCEISPSGYMGMACQFIALS